MTRLGNAAELVAVAEPVARAGAIIWWRLSGDASVEEIRAEWTARSLPEDLLPKPPTPKTALSRAILRQATSRLLARPMADRSCRALVEESARGEELDYIVALRAKIDAVGRPVFEPDDHPKVPAILAEFNRYLEMVTTDDVGSWLVSLVEVVDGVRLRDTGGVYFIPEPKIALWRQMVVAVHASTGHRINEVPALRAEDAVASILDALSHEAASVAAEMEDELRDGLTPRKARTRVRRCEATEEKVARYEELLGASAEGLRARLESLRASLAVVALSAEDSADGVSLAAL